MVRPMADEADLLARALTGDPASVRELVDVLTPVIQARVARALRRTPGRRARAIQQEVEDMTQEVFIALFADGGRTLRAWDADRGLTLAGFVGLVAQRQVVSIMRSGRRSPWTQDPLEPGVLESVHGSAASHQPRVESREELRLLASQLKATLSPKGFDLFMRLFVANQSLDEVRAETGLSDAAVYAWRSRLRKVVGLLAANFEKSTMVSSDSGPSTRTPLEDETP